MKPARPAPALKDPAPLMIQKEGTTVVAPGPVMTHPAGTCADGSCGSCAEGCCDECCPEKCCFYAGAGFYMFKPIGNNIAWRSHHEFLQPDGRFVSSSFDTNFNNSLSFGPRFWIGVVNPCGLGVRARYWSLSQTVGTTIRNDYPSNTAIGAGHDSETLLSAAPFFGEPGFHNGSGGDDEGEAVDTISAGFGHALVLSNKIRLNVADFEVTQAVDAGKWLLLTGGGVRWGRIIQDYQALDLQYINNVPFPIRKVAKSTNSFDGFGPTVSLEIRRPLGDSGFALYGSARGAVLFGDRRLHAEYAEFDRNTNFNRLFQAFDRRYNDVLPIGELELGGLYSQNMGSMTPFLQVGFVTQTWFGAGTATTYRDNLGFIGLTAAAGVTF